jgi:transposase InsO family protein
MSKKGECYDNAVAESFFNTLKTEFISQRTMLQEHKQRVPNIHPIKSFSFRALFSIGCQRPFNTTSQHY